MDGVKHNRYQLSLAQLIRRFFRLFIIALAIFGLHFFLSLIIIRALTPSEYGDFAVIMRSISFCVPFVLWGCEVAVIRAYPLYLTQKDYSSISGFRRWAIHTLKISTVFVFIIGVIVMLVSWHLDNIHLKLDHYHPILYSLWLIPIAALVKFQDSELLALQQFVLSKIFKIGMVIILLATVVLIEEVKGSLHIYNVIAGLTVSMLITVMIQRFILRIKFPKQAKMAKPNYRDKKHWRKESAEMMISRVLNESLGAVGIIMLEVIGKSDHDVGMYAAMSVLIGLVGLGQIAGRVIIGPEVSYMLEGHKKAKLQRLINIFNCFKLGIGFLVALVLIIFGKDLLRFFGPAYAHLYLPLMLFMLFKIFALLVGFGRPLLLFTEHEDSVMKIAILQLALMIILGVILIPVFQLYGAIFAVGISRLIASILIFCSVKKLLKLKLLFIF